MIKKNFIDIEEIRENQMSLFVSNTYNTRIPYVQQPKKAVVERNLPENIEFAGCNLSESQEKALINEDEQKQQKKKKIRVIKNSTKIYLRICMLLKMT